MIWKAKAWFRPPVQNAFAGPDWGVMGDSDRKDVATENALHIINFRMTQTVEYYAMTPFSHRHLFHISTKLF